MENDSMPLFPQAYPHAKVISSEEMHQPTVSQPKPTSPAPPPPIHIHQPLLLGPDNTIITCPFCSATIKTAVKYTTTTQTHIAAASCYFVCCCCCIPYLMDSAKNSDHYCPNCKLYLGTYRR